MNLVERAVFTGGRAVRWTWRKGKRVVARRRLRRRRARSMPCPRRCGWHQTRPGTAQLDRHMAARHGPKSAGRGGRPARGPVRAPRPARAGAGQTVAPGVIAARINDLVREMGAYVDQVRAVSRALGALGEIEPDSLHDLMDAFAGLQACLVAAADTINDVVDYADTELWVDVAALRPAWQSADDVLAATDGLRRSVNEVRRLYPERIDAEAGAGPTGGARPLNPDRLAPVGT